ncbi:nucleophile aminohydrolase [Collybia nuda]|uniref:Nucleophile aminohydrolase n=1 Tax=Collybia nuda TaxID=64659 RepID=A0A9P6CKF1_9AGAR|nr:nucleophile aminohydrolase [Collybia nuda]
MVENAIASLEDDVNLNAGYGSNLTLNGMVECDAAIMEGISSDFGSVGAVSGIKNPIRLARSLLEYSRIPDTLGRIPPLLLVSEGALSFAALHAPHVQTVPPERLISWRAEAEWKKWKDQIEYSHPTDSPGGGSGPGEMQDTVGAVSWHPEKGMAAGVSSGGILLKYPGRVGEAAVFGAGCWVHQSTEAGMGIACSVSGVGEYITRAALARTIGENFASHMSEGIDFSPHDILHKVIMDNFWQPSVRRGILQLDVGVLLLASELDKDGNVKARLWCAFTTPSMAIAYASSKNPKPKAVILRRPTGIPVPIRNNNSSQIFITAISL